MGRSSWGAFKQEPPGEIWPLHDEVPASCANHPLVFISTSTHINKGNWSCKIILLSHLSQEANLQCGCWKSRAHSQARFPSVRGKGDPRSPGDAKGSLFLERQIKPWGSLAVFTRPCSELCGLLFMQLAVVSLGVFLGPCLLLIPVSDSRSRAWRARTRPWPCSPSGASEAIPTAWTARHRVSTAPDCSSDLFSLARTWGAPSPGLPGVTFPLLFAHFCFVKEFA